MSDRSGRWAVVRLRRETVSDRTLSFKEAAAERDRLRRLHPNREYSLMSEPFGYVDDDDDDSEETP